MTNKKKFSRMKRGFTVAELLIVIGIIAVLVAILIPVFINHREKANEAYDIYTMRSAASAAIELYYSDITNSDTARSAGVSYYRYGVGNPRNNAYGIYNPATNKFVSSYGKVKAYGKGTKRDGETKFVYEGRSAYDSAADYSNAVIQIAIFPEAEHPYAEIAWKPWNNGAFVGATSSNYQDSGYPRMRINFN